MTSPRATVIQMTSSQRVEKNLQDAAYFLKEAAREGSRLVVLPEMWATLFPAGAQKRAVAETFGEGPIQEFLQQQAKQLGVWIVGGTIPLKTSHSARIRAACLVWNEEGTVVARYDKIHLFDATITPGVESYEESSTTEPGDTCVTVETPLGKLGLAVCYDIRFPELFRSLFREKIDCIAIPAAFTPTTGKAHWNLLARARAVENSCYVLGACEWGTHDTGRKTFGGSCIINPWGDVLCERSEGTGLLTASIDLSYLKELRSRMPLHEHARWLKK